MNPYNETQDGKCAEFVEQSEKTIAEVVQKASCASQMSPDQQRIAIAEACGWKPCGWRPVHSTDKATDLALGGTEKWWRNAEEKTVARFDELPDYLNDLNAMHEAEQVLINSSRYHIYCNWLDQLVGSRHHPHKACSKSATAAQRAEAFLRTLNLYN